MHSNAASPIVSIRFGNLDTFCEELAARGPNIEPVVRICQQVRRGHSEDLGPLPIEHVFGHVSYLRRTEDVLQVRALHLHLGERWAYPMPPLIAPKSGPASTSSMTGCGNAAGCSVTP